MFALEVRNVSKIFRLYNRPADRLKEILLRRRFYQEFKALEGISLSLLSGETLGIIGENGAGKSTLLKILAGTLAPTSGEVIKRGRTAALLELGASFHPEFTGRQNIYLNAALLGLKEAEIRDREQDIIDFAQLGQFIDRPVKTYSSGMYVRLAFSIATRVDPHILIIDEALSVGDQRFQKKCIDRMMGFREAGKTIIFCSHSMYLVQELCGKAIWLRNGRLVESGDAATVINAYTDWLRAYEAKVPVLETKETEAKPHHDKLAWIEALEVTDGDGHPIEYLKTGEDLWLRIRIGASATAPRPGHIGLGVNRNDNEPVFGTTTRMDGLSHLSLVDGAVVNLRFPAVRLLAGQYFISVVLTDEHALHLYDQGRTHMFSIVNSAPELGLVHMEHEWQIQGQANP